MRFENLLDDVQAVNGYRASGVMTHTGDMLVQHAADGNIDLVYVGALLNDLFRSAHQANTSLGFQECSQMSMRSASGSVLMCCSGSQASTHLHAIAVLEPDGNRALAERLLERMLPEAVSAL